MRVFFICDCVLAYTHFPVKTSPGGTCNIWLFELLAPLTLLQTTGEPTASVAKVQQLFPSLILPSVNSVICVAPKESHLLEIHWNISEKFDQTYKR